MDKKYCLLLTKNIQNIQYRYIEYVYRKNAHKYRTNTLKN